MPTITSQFLDKPIFRIVSETAVSRNMRAFVIGGYVRDCFLGRPCNDIDIVVEGAASTSLWKSGRGRPACLLFQEFRHRDAALRPRRDQNSWGEEESYRRESRKPIVENGTLEDDQRRRDYDQRDGVLLQPDSFGGWWTLSAASGICRRRDTHASRSGHDLFRRPSEDAARRPFRDPAVGPRPYFPHRGRVDGVDAPHGGAAGNSQGANLRRTQQDDRVRTAFDGVPPDGRGRTAGLHTSGAERSQAGRQHRRQGPQG